MSVVGSCSQSLRRGGTQQDTRESSSGRVLMLKVRAELTNTALMSSRRRAEAGLPFSSNISSPIFKPEKDRKNRWVSMCCVCWWHTCGREGRCGTPSQDQGLHETEPPPAANYHLISRTFSGRLYPIRLIATTAVGENLTAPSSWCRIKIKCFFFFILSTKPIMSSMCACSALLCSGLASESF